MISAADNFVEADYLAMYPDIAQAIKSGNLSNALSHFLVHGRDEGRKGYIFDEPWYARSYPLAVLEVESGKARSLQEHYETVGRHRGYIPHQNALRPDNPAAIPSRFGGLWIDQPNAQDIVAGRADIGLITQKDAERLRFFIENGYLIIEFAVDDECVARALGDFDKAYSGGFEQLKFECNDVTKDHTAWRPEFNDLPAKALDLHWFLSAVRDLIFSKQVAAFLGLIFECKPFVSQTLGFYRGSAQEAHQDLAYVPYTQQRGFAASWIALEDASAGAGELFYYPGSHRFPDFLYNGKFKNVNEATRTGLPLADAGAMVHEHVASLPKRADEMGLQERVFIPKRGDALIWHADLAHGGKPISVARSRKSVVTHYCLKYSSPLFSERLETRFCDHNLTGFYTSSIYSHSPC